MVRWLESQGYDVSYCTDVYTHEQASMLLQHRAFLVVGHDEYWSWQMRTNVVSARDKGVNLGFFASNVCMWQIRFESSLITCAADRPVVCYNSTSDPVKGNLETIQWRRLGLPESQFIGVLYIWDPANGDISVKNTWHW